MIELNGDYGVCWQSFLSKFGSKKAGFTTVLFIIGSDWPEAISSREQTHVGKPNLGGGANVAMPLGGSTNRVGTWGGGQSEGKLGWANAPFSPLADYRSL